MNNNQEYKDNKRVAKELAQEYKAFGKRTAERFRQITNDDELSDLSDKYKDIDTAYRGNAEETSRAYKAAAKEAAKEYRAFGKAIANRFREANIND